MLIKYFVGIDIAKATLDITVLNYYLVLCHNKIKNTSQDIKAWLVELTKVKGIKKGNILFCMENMGLYGAFLVWELQTQKANIWLESCLQIKKSLGITRGKSDKLDSLRIEIS